MGYMGKYLRVDLSDESITKYSLDISFARKFIGGKGLGAKLLYDGLDAGVNPLSPDNMILFMTGPLTGTSIQTSGRWCIVTKSPQTGIFNDSHIGGHFGYRLKRSGYDYIEVDGKASSPSFLEISEEHVDIHPAADLWGQGTFETERILKNRYPKSEVISIGPAGENLVLYACAVTGKTHIAGRGGVGAVMGSKNLKALVVHGQRPIETSDPTKFAELSQDLRKRVFSNPGVKLRHELGTVMWVRRANDAGILPTHNFQSGTFDGAEAISGERMRDEHVIGHTACYACGIACGKTTKFESGDYAPLEVDGPEYETTALLGSNCGIDNLAAIAKLSQICDDLGLDTISTGGSVAFAIEASNKGVLLQEDIDNLEFGNAKAVIQLVNLIATRRGVGDILARGSLSAAQQLNEDSVGFAIQVKGMELPGVEPRASWGMALAYATADRGGCHQRCWTPSAELSGALPRFSMKGVPQYVKEVQDERAVCYSLVLCDFLPFDVPEMVDILNSATGFSFTEESYIETGERIWNLIRMFNVREGISSCDDVLPERFTSETLPNGDGKGLKVPSSVFATARGEYYRLRGWDQTGIPSDKLLKSLHLNLD
ncbi:aldehyde ferredoxin oxidoreductase [Candidatus Thorarchaeota archaeon]|nr:MAG: aldehyde ferredoxin oxidoreductase [Candidatus Thorarchaeota archaeon]